MTSYNTMVLRAAFKQLKNSAKKKGIKVSDADLMRVLKANLPAIKMHVIQ